VSAEAAWGLSPKIRKVKKKKNKIKKKVRCKGLMQRVKEIGKGRFSLGMMAKVSWPASILGT
jgi:hypothetical protein